MSLLGDRWNGESDGYPKAEPGREIKHDGRRWESRKVYISGSRENLIKENKDESPQFV